MVLDPVHKQHRIPVDAAHFFRRSLPSRGRALAANAARSALMNSRGRRRHRDARPLVLDPRQPRRARADDAPRGAGRGRRGPVRRPAGVAVARFRLGGGFGGAADAGANPPFGAAVFFQVPASYDGTTPASLTFADASGRTIRRFDLHQKAARPVKLDTIEDPTARREAIEAQATSIVPGMNQFQWDLRYPDATEVTGFQPPVAAGGLPDDVDGPTVTPGSYRVTLTYGDRKLEQRFDVALDPRIHATAARSGAVSRSGSGSIPTSMRSTGRSTSPSPRATACPRPRTPTGGSARRPWTARSTRWCSWASRAARGACCTRRSCAATSRISLLTST